MNAKDMAALLGTDRFVKMEGEFLVRCTVEDVKVSYGSVRVLVHPVGGSGEAWVMLDRTSLPPCDYCNDGADWRGCTHA